MSMIAANGPRKFLSIIGASLSVAALVLGVGLSGCGGDEEGNSSGGAGSIDLTKKDESPTAGAPLKSAGGLRGKGLGNDAPDAKKKKGR